MHIENSPIQNSPIQNSPKNYKLKEKNSPIQNSPVQGCWWARCALVAALRRSPALNFVLSSTLCWQARNTLAWLRRSLFCSLCLMNKGQFSAYRFVKIVTWDCFSDCFVTDCFFVLSQTFPDCFVLECFVQTRKNPKSKFETKICSIWRSLNLFPLYVSRGETVF